MQSLNDRLIIYIDTVRALQDENRQLKNDMSNFNEGSTREVTEIKVLYERELDDAKRLIDELARDKARFEIEVNKYKANFQEANEKLNRALKETKEGKSYLQRIESELSEYKSRCDSMSTDLKRKTEELNGLRPQCSDLEKHLSQLRKQLEEETLCRVDLENKNATLKEDLNFKSQVYEKETDQLRSSKRSEIEQVDNRLRDEYDSKLMSELNHIRQEADNKIHEMKTDVEKRYQNKAKEAETSAKRLQNTVDALREELGNHRSKHTEYEVDIKNLTNKVVMYEGRVKELEDKLKSVTRKADKDLAEKDAEIDKTSNELSELMSDYQELYDIKIALDMEIEAYRKILEAEETRLNITTTGNCSKLGTSSYLNDSLSAGTAKKSKKRKVDGNEVSQGETSNLVEQTVGYEQSAVTTVGVEICEMEFEYKSIKLQNKTPSDFAIGGCVIKQTAEGAEVEYKLPAKRVIKAGESLTIWSHSSADSKAGDDLVMSGSKNWLNGASVITVVNDKEGNEMSRRECMKVETSSIVKSEVKTSTSFVGKLFSWGKK